MSLCQYKSVLGKPHQGVHEPRFLGMARNDWIMTIVGAFLFTLPIISLWRHPKSFLRMWFIMLVTLVGLGIILHRIFCVRTTVDQWLFPDLGK